MLARMRGKRNPHTLLLVVLLWKAIWRFLKKLNVDLPYDPAIPLLGIYPKECNSGYYKGTCTPMFTAALFTVAKLQKQPGCLSTDEWIKKVWYWALVVHACNPNYSRKCGIYTQWNFIQPQRE
jgi:hypothetical protein